MRALARDDSRTILIISFTTAISRAALLAGSIQRRARSKSGLRLTGLHHVLMELPPRVMALSGTANQALSLTRLLPSIRRLRNFRPGRFLPAVVWCGTWLRRPTIVSISRAAV